MYASESISELATAMAKAQADMKAAEMNSKNPFLKNSYADLGSIIEAIRPAIAKYGISFTQMPSFDGEKVTVDTLIMHASGQWLRSTLTLAIEGEKGLSLAQVMGKAITYLRRYGLSAMFGVYADKDDDGNDTGADSTKATAKPATNGNVPNCPKCAGPMWDNREGKTNPKQPDFKCKNKECGGAIWPPKDAQQQPSNQPEPQNDDAPKLAAIRTPKFGPYATTLADKWPKYRNAQGSFDANHIQASIATNLKVYDITDANIDALFAKLHQRAIDQTNVEEAPF